MKLDNRKISWRKSGTKIDGSPRKQSKIWSIPAEIRNICSIVDGDILDLVIKLHKRSWSIELKITSGSEYNVPKFISDEIEKFMKENPRADIVFELALSSTSCLQEDFDAAVQMSKKSTPEDRRKRLAEAPKKPTSKFVVAKVFSRNPDVVAEKLYQVNGICEACNRKGPFIRKNSKDKDVYLEVHHEKPLGKGGDDTLQNVRALCPNCHRKVHYGQ